tara:strand:- start:29 stop:298 length:270 start_codon:yes stop_codon:yes gene_type:complete
MNKIEQLEHFIEIDTIRLDAHIEEGASNSMIDHWRLRLETTKLYLEIEKGEKVAHTPVQLQYMMCEGVVDILQKQLNEFGKAVDSLKVN